MYNGTICNTHRGFNKWEEIQSGSDVSLISETHRSMFAPKIEKYETSLRGIIPGKLFVTEQIHVTVEINDVEAELTLLLVPSHILDFDLLISRNLYQNEEIATLTDQAGSRVIRKYFPGVRRVFDHQLVERAYEVPEEYADVISNVLSEHSEMITTGNKVPAIKTASLKIRLIDNHIVHRPPHRLSLQERQATKEIVDDLLENEIIRPSESPYVSPILLVRKKEGSYRMCVNYRELNFHTVKDRYPLPLIDAQIDRLGKAKFYTSVDMAAGFHQIPVHPDSIEKTGFVTPRRPLRISSDAFWVGQLSLSFPTRNLQCFRTSQGYSSISLFRNG